MSRGGGGLERVHAAPSSPCGCWMSALEEGWLRASRSRLCLWGQVGSLGAGRRPVTGGSWARTMRSGVFGEWLWPRAGPAPRGSGSQAAEGGPTPSGLLGSVPSELGRRKGPGPRGSCEDVEGSSGAGAGPKEPSGPSSPLHPGPTLTQPGLLPSWDLQLFVS